MRSAVDLLAVVLLGACAPAGRPVPAPSAAAVSLRDRRAELTAADSSLAATARRDARALVAGADGDVVFLFGGLRIVRGRAAFASTLDSLARGPMQTLGWRAVRVDVSADGGSGYSLGYGERAARGDGAAPMKYIAFWRRTARGAWTLAALTISRGGGDAPAGPPAGCESPTIDRAAWAREDATASRATLVGADSSFAAEAAAGGPGPAFLHWIAADGISLGGAERMTCGPAALAHAFDGSGPGSLTWAPRIGFASAAGDLGFTVGVAHWQDGSSTAVSKYLTIWKRQPDGGWRFVADGGNVAPPDA